MLLSAAMMLDWLGHRNQFTPLIEDGNKLKEAVYTVVNEGKHTTSDIGGNASTTQACEAVLDCLA